MAKTFMVQADGMTCQACVEMVTDAFQEFEGVENVTVDLENQTITVDSGDKTNITDDQITELLDKRGYKFISISR
jgi:copper chaperone CopZ